MSIQPSRNWSSCCLTQWGIVMDPITPGVYQLVPDHRYADPLPGFRPSGLTVTTDRALALTREELDFLTGDHPLVTGAMEHHLGTGKGSAAFAFWRSSNEQRVFLEMLFVIEAVALTNSALRSFLPPTPLRVVVDHQLSDGQPGLPDQEMHRLTDGSSSRWSTILPTVSHFIPNMVEAGRTMAQEKAKPIIGRRAAHGPADNGGDGQPA